MKNYQTPKQVSDFAKAYEQLYIAAGQCQKAFEYERDRANRLQQELNEIKGNADTSKPQ